MKSKSNKGTPEYLIAKLILNSAYGKLGMSPNLEHHKIINTNELNNNFNRYTITNVIEIDDDLILISYFKDKSIDEIEIEYSNISIPVAAFISGIGRVVMYDYKTIKNNPPYYTDTDSIVLGKNLDAELVGDSLGKMKLEHFIEIGVFLAPKLYGIQTKTGFISKAKGLKTKNLKLIDYLNLLEKNSSIRVKQDKWHKDIIKGEIKIKEEDFNLKITDGKRKLIYDDNNKFVDTKPLVIIEE